MKQSVAYLSLLLACVVCTSVVQGAEGWRIDTTEEWQAAEQESGGLVLSDGLATPTNPSCFYRSVTRRFSKQRSGPSFQRYRLPTRTTPKRVTFSTLQRSKSLFPSL